MFRRAVVVGLLPALVAVCTLAGCGSDRKPSSTAATPGASSSASPGASPGDSASSTRAGTSKKAKKAAGQASGQEPGALAATTRTRGTVSMKAARQAEKATESLLDATANLLASPETLVDDAAGTQAAVGAAITGSAWEGLVNQAAEYADNGWHVVGRPEIVRMTIRDGGERQLQVRACLDQSGVRVVDGDGVTLPRGSEKTRTLIIYTLESAAGGWQVVDQTFPQRPDC